MPQWSRAAIPKLPVLIMLSKIKSLFCKSTVVPIVPVNSVRIGQLYSLKRNDPFKETLVKVTDVRKNFANESWVQYTFDNDTQWTLPEVNFMDRYSLKETK